MEEKITSGKDFKGNRLKIGDHIAVIGYGRSPDLNLGRVVGFTNYMIKYVRLTNKDRKTVSTNVFKKSKSKVTKI